eukprot:GHVR01064647.1.p1 GENE.GHVR01064647.1~~GHVR01064647.1.p1  ORF type:complete len:394 (+),score=96.90 GHVR01064647.1:36-1217(+)
MAFLWGMAKDLLVEDNTNVDGDDSEGNDKVVNVSSESLSSREQILPPPPPPAQSPHPPEQLEGSIPTIHHLSPPPSDFGSGGICSKSLPQSPKGPCLSPPPPLMSHRLPKGKTSSSPMVPRLSFGVMSRGEKLIEANRTKLSALQYSDVSGVQFDVSSGSGSSGKDSRLGVPSGLPSHGRERERMYLEELMSVGAMYAKAKGRDSIGRGPADLFVSFNNETSISSDSGGGKRETSPRIDAAVAAAAASVDAATKLEEAEKALLADQEQLELTVALQGRLVYIETELEESIQTNTEMAAKLQHELTRREQLEAELHEAKAEATRTAEVQREERDRNRAETAMLQQQLYSTQQKYEQAISETREFNNKIEEGQDGTTRPMGQSEVGVALCLAMVK